MPVAGARHCPERAQRGVVLRTAEGGETPGEERDVVEAGVRVGVQIAPKPPCACAAVAMRALVRDQVDELEQLAERRPAQLSEGRFRDEQVAVFTGSLEERTRMTGGQ
jgi:hypothetical protein